MEPPYHTNIRGTTVQLVANSGNTNERVSAQNGTSPVPNSTNNNNSNNNKRQQQQQPISIPKNMILVRGFSKVQANEEILNETRYQIESSLCRHSSSDEEHMATASALQCQHHQHTELPDYSFMLPDLNKFDNYKFKEYLQSDLIELPTQYALIESGHLNWWCQGDWEQVNRELYPMVTSGDGNCLLHAASLAMWGLHDRYLTLRKALHASLEQITENQSALWRRWKWEQMCQNRKYGLIYNDEEWAKEWQSLLKLSSYQPRIAVANSKNRSSNHETGTTLRFSK